jgi:NADH-quinone oxidoreductase subunit D
MDEIEQSLRIIEQACAKIPAGEIQGKVPRVLKLPVGDTCFATECGRGRFLVRITSDGGENPYRVRLRTPCFTNLTLFEEASQGMMLADALSLMASLDLVIPDIDR